MSSERDSATVAGQLIEFETVRSPRRRRTIELSVGAGGRVRVSAPVWTSQAEIVALVGRRADWIARQRERLTQQAPPLEFRTGDRIPCLGRDVTLEVVETARRHPTAARAGEVLRLDLPHELEPATRVEAARSALAAWLRRECAAYIDGHIEWWSAAVGRTPAAVRVRDQRSRWGSCAPDGTLRFNWRLAMLDPGIVDYVIVHELAHLLVRNHSPAFWEHVERVLPDYRARKAALRTAGRVLPL
ncbi:MAG TPA: SprT family zinc-dependent metalloprotease [Dehalococcoidia bacterium]|nr:SprT family zinc-dependent metalloprotease [Dehalococcoidia bacterium]